MTSICDNAFHGCTSLTCVEIPANVTSIDGTAFMGCTSLASVTIYAPSPVGYRMAFENNAEGRKIYVFSDCIDDYKNDDDWITYGYANATEPITLAANYHHQGYRHHGRQRQRGDQPGVHQEQRRWRRQRIQLGVVKKG